MDKISSEQGTHVFNDGNRNDLNKANDSLAVAAAMIGHTYGCASYTGFRRLTEDEQKDYFIGIHYHLAVARKYLKKVIGREERGSTSADVRGQERSNE